MEEGKATVPFKILEDKTQDVEFAEANGHLSGDKMEYLNGGVEKHAPAPQLQCKSSERQSQETRAEAYEKQYRALQHQLRQRDMAMMELAEENEHLNKAMTELRESWKETIEDRERLTEKIKRQQASIQIADSALKKAQAEAADAKREAIEARREANDARREVTETSVALADAKAEICAVQQAAKGKALGEDERRELEGALKALSASAQRASQEAGSWKENAQLWKRKVEFISEELDSKANALAEMENELFLARKLAKDYENQVQEAKCLQTLAERALQELRQESDRRARTFNSAVKAAIGKIETDLETERDAVLEHASTLKSDLESQAQSLKEANEALSAAEQGLSAATTKINELEYERQETNDELITVKKEVEFWQSSAQALGEKAEADHEVAEGLAIKVALLESRCEELSTSSESATDRAAMLEASLVADVGRLKSAFTSAQNEKQVLQMTTSEKISKAMAEQIVLWSTISDLEGQLRTLQASGSIKKTRAHTDQWFDNLGLERVNWKSKLVHQDVEKHVGKRTNKDCSQPSTSYNRTSWSFDQNSNQDTSILRGRLSQRSIVMIIYIVVLHIIVMVSFTQRSRNCVDMASQDLLKKLPG